MCIKVSNSNSDFVHSFCSEILREGEMRAVVLVLLVLGLSCSGGERRCEAQKLAEDEGKL